MGNHDTATHNAGDVSVSVVSADLGNQQRWESLEGSLAAILRMLEDSARGRFDKPLLTVGEAAEMLSLSTKRFENIICEERAALGRTPDFVVDADGRISRRVLRDELVEWVKGRGRRPGRANAGAPRKR